MEIVDACMATADIVWEELQAEMSALQAPPDNF